MSITLDLDENSIRTLPLGSGPLERHMQIELACRYYAKGWLTFSQSARLASLDQYALAGELAERGIPRNDSVTDALEDLSDASSSVTPLRFQISRSSIGLICARSDTPSS